MNEFNIIKMFCLFLLGVSSYSSNDANKFAAWKTRIPLECREKIKPIKSEYVQITVMGELPIIIYHNTPYEIVNINKSLKFGSMQTEFEKNLL